jgi:hypothetical protein
LRPWFFFCSTEVAHMGWYEKRNVSQSIFMAIENLYLLLSAHRISLRPTEIPSVYNLIIGGSQLIDPDQICASDETLFKFIKENTGNRADIKYGEIICMSPYKSVLIVSHSLDNFDLHIFKSLNIRMVESFRKGRVLLTGGTHSPPI